MLLSLILGVLLGAVSVVFIAQNIGLVTVSFMNWQIEGSLALILFLTLISGVVITLFLILPSLIKDTFYLSALKKQKKALEDELAKTKNELAVISARPNLPEAVIIEKTVI